MDRFFSRMRVKARRLDREEKLEPGLTVSFEDPADFLEINRGNLEVRLQMREPFLQ